MVDKRTEIPDFWVYSEGIGYMSVCSSLPPYEIVERANAERPTGDEVHDWNIDKEGTFHDSSPNPSPCGIDPETHKHYLLSC